MMELKIKERKYSARNKFSSNKKGLTFVKPNLLFKQINIL